MAAMSSQAGAPTSFRMTKPDKRFGSFYKFLSRERFGADKFPLCPDRRRNLRVSGEVRFEIKLPAQQQQLGCRTYYLK